VNGGRATGTERREALLDAAAELVSAGHVEQVSMEAVADQAGVSRALVYKHFSNRHELLAAVYQRESERLHAELSAAVTAAHSVQDMYRALVRGALRAEAGQGATFAALGAAGLRTRERRQEQRRRDRTTVRFFAAAVERQYGLDPPRAKAAAAILLGALETVLGQWRGRPTPERAAQLEDVYVSLVEGGLHALVEHAGTGQRSR